MNFQSWKPSRFLFVHGLKHLAMANKLAHIPHQQIHLWFFYKPLDGLLMYKPWFTNWTQTVEWIRTRQPSPAYFFLIVAWNIERWQWPTNWKRTFVVSYISMAVKITQHISCHGSSRIEEEAFWAVRNPNFSHSVATRSVKVNGV